ncbi:hypothetical protein PILCRDRAFT_810905 [Piloderma croceum F 1598]|uniref:Carboxylic ester hydrolase n=1 Tax=Piloderma croceum (strain F 1598) TaxID=765440 RepID=A0A0C3BYJ9_PILCF|nr:hypothetical protein PILCRDRAFT_810905 [Piloderma croceum F 1598]
MMIRIALSVVIPWTLLVVLAFSSPLQEYENRRTFRNSEPVVDLGYAKYQGSTDPSTNISSFLSIRYAAPPIGSLRFQAPQAPAKMNGVQMATSVPPQCYQAGGGTSQTNPFIRNPPLSRKRGIIQTSEDCLFLDVFVPDIETADGLHVVVFIHGGGYQQGNIGSYPQADLVTDSQNHAIAVFMQYRLGAFGKVRQLSQASTYFKNIAGFLAGPSMAKSGALNAGLLDQDFALQWVQQHIRLFGGNPAKVTIWGESGGAGSVLQHIVAHGGRTDPPRFRAAITSSVALLPQYAADDPIPTFLYDQMTNLTNCSNAVDTFACLIAVDADALNNANNAVTSSAFYETYVFVPVVDGTFIVERPTITMDRQVVNGDVLLSVTNTFEGSTFTLPSETNTTDFVRQMFPFLTAKQIDTAASYYTALNTTLPTVLNQSIAVMGECSHVSLMARYCRLLLK